MNTPVCRRPLTTTQKYPLVTKKHPYVSEDVKKYPVTKEDIALHLGQGLPCVSEAQKMYRDVLHDSVYKLVHKLVIQYEPDDETRRKDLFNDCWERIIKKLHLFKPSRGGFSTWCWWVCLSVLNRQATNESKRTKFIVEMPEGLDPNRAGTEDARTGATRMDFQEAISDLCELYPEHRCIIEAMFKDTNGFVNEKVVYRDISRRSGFSVPKVRKFYLDVIKPFFIKRFKGGEDGRYRSR